MLTSEQEKIVKDMVSEHVDREVREAEKNQAERLKQSMEENPNFIQGVKDRLFNTWESYANEILDKDVFVKRFLRGFLHPSNKIWRKLFTALTGIEVGQTNFAAKEAGAKYLSQERIDKYIAWEESEKQKLKDATRARIENAKKAEIENITNLIKTNQPISGSELIIIAKHLQIKVPLRTQGMIMKKCHNITRYKCSTSATPKSSQRVFDIYKEVLTKLGLP